MVGHQTRRNCREGAGVSENESPEGITGATEELEAAEIGAMLRETRSAFQRELSDIASELRIRLVYLEAIEEGRLDRLPGPAYASGFLRAYGDYLGLDGEDLVNKFKLAGVGGGRMDLQLPSPAEEGRLPTGSILLVAAVLAISAYIGWYYLSSQGRDPLKFVASLPDYFVTLIGGAKDERGVLETAAAAEPVETGGPVAEMPRPEQTNEIARATEEKIDAPIPPLPSDANTEEIRVSAEIVETKIVKKVEAVETASVVPVVPIASTENKPKLVALPPSKLPTLPSVKRVSPPPPVPPSPDRSSETERSELTHSPEDAPPVHEIPSPRPEPVITVTPAPPLTQSVSTAPVEEIGEQSNAPIEGDNPVSENGIPETATARVAVITPPVQPASEISPATTTNEEVPYQVVVRATADSWVEVRSGNENPMLSKVLHAGEIYEVPSLPGLILATGNAGGIEIVVNGRALPLLGPMGAVRRDVALDAESLLSGAVQAR